MTTVELKSSGGNTLNCRLTRRHSGRLLTPDRKALPLGQSLRLPVTPENRSRLRALRESELQAWHRFSQTSSNAALRAELRRTAQEEKRESRLFAGIAIPAAIAVALGLLASTRFIEHHGDFVALIRQLLGLI